MQTAPPRDDEAQTLARLRLLEVLDSEPEAEFDALVRTASLACGTPIALISLIDADRQWFKANIGLAGVAGTARDVAFCAHAVRGDGLFEVPNAATDPRFADNPLVSADPAIRFYAGAPIRLSDGHAVGTVCVIDRQPRALSDSQRALLESLAVVAASVLEGRQARLQLGRAAVEKEASLRRLYESTPALLHSIDANGRVLAVSDAWLAKMGYARDQVEGQPSTDFLTPASREHALRVVLPQFFASGRCDQIEYQMQVSDGSLIDVLLSATLERDADGRPLRSLAVSEDVTLRRRAERALVMERQRLANIIEGTDTATLEWNLRSDELRVNRRFAQMIGRNVDPDRPTTMAAWLVHTHPDDRARHDELLREHLAGQSPLFQCETRVQHADGRWVWVLTRGRVIAMADDGRPEWLYGVRLDISPRKLQEENLRRSEAFLSRTGTLAGVGGWELDLASGKLSWSDQTRRIHAVAADYQPMVNEAINFYAPEARPAIQAAVDHGIASGEPWDLELPLVRADGRRIWARAVGAAEFSEGKPVRLVGAFQDITERMQLQTRLNEVAQQVQDLYDNAPCGYHSLDPQGHFLHVNATELSWLGCTRDELIGRCRVTEFFTAEGRQQFERSYPQLMASGFIEGLEFDLVPRRGAGRRVSVSATAQFDEDGMFQFSRTVMFDITPLKEAEAARIAAQALDAENRRLRELGRMKDQFLANMSHELRTPLNAVLGFAQLLQMGSHPPDSAKHGAFVRQIEASGQHLLQLIDSMLDHAKAESGQIEIHPERVDLGLAVQQVAGMLQAKCERRQVVIAYSIEQDLGRVFVDPMRLRQVLLNLVGNAVKFSHAGGQVLVRAHDDGLTHLRIEVEDHGIGIAAADLPRLFTLFTQLSEGNTKAYEGTGIGLALVRRLVEAQGGQVGVSSTLGVGSVFHFTLPKAQVSGPEGESASGLAAATQRP